MINMETGMLPKSKEGHDRGKLYIIIRAEAGNVLGEEGICPTDDNP